MGARVVAPRRANLHGGMASRAVMAAKRNRLEVALHAQQRAFVTNGERFSFYVGGRGAGKSFAGALRSLLAAQELPGSLGLVGAPTYAMLRDSAQRMFFDLCPPALIASHNKAEGHTVMANGAEILWRSMDNADRVRGLNLAWFWLDEAPWCGYEVWKLLKATLRQAGYPTVAWATGTPRGRDGYALDFELARREHHALFRASTRANAHNLPEGFIEDLGYSGQFAEQEIEGRFVSFEGLVYAFDGSEGGHVRRRAGAGVSGDAAAMGVCRVVGGIDWGYTNPCAAVVFALDGERRAWQTAEYYQRRASLETEIIPALVDLSRREKVVRWYCDPEDPEAIARFNAALASAGLATRAQPAKKGPGSVRAGIQTVTTALALRGDGTRGLYVDPGCVHTIAEYGAYAYASDAAKRDPSEQPVKQSDHAMDATRYALHEELAGAARTEAYLAEMARMSGRSEAE